MAKRRRKRKKTMKWYKKILLLLIIIGMFFVVTFFVDKKTFNQLKDGVILEITKLTNTLEKKLQIFRIERYDDIELTDDLMVFYLDVGQADSILIKSQDEYMLIDAGNTNDGDRLVKYFNYLPFIFKSSFLMTAKAPPFLGSILVTLIKLFCLDKFKLHLSMEIIMSYK